MADDTVTESGVSTDTSRIEHERQLIRDAKSKGPRATLGVYLKLSGPGWLQGAITLGGGSLAGSLYLGVLGGTSLLWLQPLAMIMGIIMLSAIGYVTLCTKERPFQAINNHVSPVLGWGWLIATLMANLVWSLPTFGLATAAIRQNLLPGVVGPEAMPDHVGKLIVCFGIMLTCVVVVWFYASGSKGVRVFEAILKLMVAVIVACFFGVVIKMSFAEGGLNWDGILRGLIPDLNLLFSPAKTFAPFIAEVDSRFQDFWTNHIVSQQRDVMVTAAAAAVGINMTVLLPYSMRKRGWDRDFRGLAIFDLSTGLFIPYILTTGCVVIVSAMTFHTDVAPGFLGETDQAGVAIQPPKNLAGRYEQVAGARILYEAGDSAFAGMTEEEKNKKIESLMDELPPADKRMAAMLVKRDAFNLAQSLAPLTGGVIAHYIFGIGVVGMAMSSAIILMLINGFVICEMLGIPSKGWPYRLGCLMPCVGVLGPFVWTGGKAQFWLMVPTSMFAMVVLPIAYFTFYLLMNQKSLLGEDMPRGTKRVLWNVLMAIAAGLAAFGSVWSLWSKMRWIGIGAIVAFVLLALVVHFVRSAGTSPSAAEKT